MKILIVKLGALGDVLRTTPLLTEFKRRYPGSEITWLVDAQCREVLEHNPFIDHLVSYSEESVLDLKRHAFDLAVNLDKEAEALFSITAVSARKKMGFGSAGNGEACALDDLSDYAYRLGVDDDLKFKKNKKTYQEISFEQLGFEFNKQEYIFPEDPQSDLFSKSHLASLGLDLNKSEKLVVGINTGSGKRFAGKKLPLETYAGLADKFSVEMGAAVLLLGGKDEIERNRDIKNLCKQPVINTGSHSIRHFASIVKNCGLIVSGDTTAMHIAIAVRVPVVAYFASTCSAEIELYGRGKKVISGIDCAPCYKRVCPIDEKCMKDMTVDEIFNAAREVLGYEPARS